MAIEAAQVFHKLSELSEALGVETSVLRFWEKEFEGLVKPLKVGPRKRLYRPRDLEIFREIKRLLYEERFTIAGARKRLEKSGGRQGRLFEEKGDRLAAAFSPEETGGQAEAELRSLRAVLAETRRELKDLRRLLAPEPAPPEPAPPEPDPDLAPPPALPPRPLRARRASAPKKTETRKKKAAADESADR